MRKFVAVMLSVMALTALDVFAQVPGPVVLNVGGRSVTIPAPEGSFLRCDGINKEWDDFSASLLPETNRRLAYFGTKEDRDVLSRGKVPNFEKSYFIQVLKAIEAKEIGERTYSEVRDEVKKGLQTVQSRLDEEIEKASRAGDRKLKEKAGPEAALSFSGTAPLGVFEDTTNALGFSMALKSHAKAGSGGIEDRSVVSAIVTPVNGRLLFLYCSQPYQSDADQKKAEASLVAWRNGILAANPKIEGPSASSFSFYNLGRATVVGAMIGAFVGLVSKWLKSRLKSRSHGE